MLQRIKLDEEGWEMVVKRAMHSATALIHQMEEDLEAKRDSVWVSEWDLEFEKMMAEVLGERKGTLMVRQSNEMMAQGSGKTLAVA